MCSIQPAMRSHTPLPASSHSVSTLPFCNKHSKHLISKLNYSLTEHTFFLPPLTGQYTIHQTNHRFSDNCGSHYNLKHCLRYRPPIYLLAPICLKKGKCNLHKWFSCSIFQIFRCLTSQCQRRFY